MPVLNNTEGPENNHDNMIGDKKITITIKETLSSYCRVKLGLTPAEPRIFIIDGVIEHVDNFRADLEAALNKLIAGWEACKDIVFTPKEPPQPQTGPECPECGATMDRTESWTGQKVTFEECPECGLTLEDPIMT